MTKFSFCVLFLVAISLENSIPVVSQENDLPVIYDWKYIDYVWESDEQRQRIIDNGGYVKEKNIPIDIDVSPDGRTFMTVIRDTGVPSSLNVISETVGEGGNLLQPYPDWSYATTDCSGIYSVYRVSIIRNTLYVLDNGKLNDATACPARLLAFDLATDRLLMNLTIPDEIANNSTTGLGLLVTPIIVPLSNDPLDIEAILADVSGYALVTYNPNKGFRRITSSSLDPRPEGVLYTINGESFQLEDGTVGMALSPNTRQIYLSPMSSFNMVQVSLYDLITAETSSDVDFRVYENVLPTQSSAKAMSKSGILFFGLVNSTSIGCWNERLPLTRENIDIVAQNEVTLQFVSGLKIKPCPTPEGRIIDTLLVMTNRFQKVMTGTLRTDEINFRFMKSSVYALTRGTACQCR